MDVQGMRRMCARHAKCSRAQDLLHEVNLSIRGHSRALRDSKEPTERKKVLDELLKRRQREADTAKAELDEAKTWLSQKRESFSKAQDMLQEAKDEYQSFEIAHAASLSTGNGCGQILPQPLKAALEPVQPL